MFPFFEEGKHRKRISSSSESCLRGTLGAAMSSLCYDKRGESVDKADVQVTWCLSWCCYWATDLNKPESDFPSDLLQMSQFGKEVNKPDFIHAYWEHSEGSSRESSGLACRERRPKAKHSSLFFALGLEEFLHYKCFLLTIFLLLIIHGFIHIINAIYINNNND